MTDELWMSSVEYCQTPSGASLFRGFEEFNYHTRNLRARLIKAGCMILVGNRVRIKPKAFEAEWVRISLEIAEDANGQPKKLRDDVKSPKRVHVSERGADDPLGMKRSADLSSQAHQQAREFMKRTQRVRGKV